MLTGLVGQTASGVFRSRGFPAFIHVCKMRLRVLLGEPVLLGHVRCNQAMVTFHLDISVAGVMCIDTWDTHTHRILYTFFAFLTH